MDEFFEQIEADIKDLSERLRDLRSGATSHMRKQPGSVEWEDYTTELISEAEDDIRYLAGFLAGVRQRVAEGTPRA